MNFATIGSIGTYTKSMKMQMQWKQKESTGNFTQKADTGGSGQTSELDFLRKQLEDLRDNADVEKSAIYAKLHSGKKLSAEEQAYLKETDPASYQKFKEVEAERVRYEEELKKCRTKEDFERLKYTKMSMSMARANAIANDPAIPAGKKMELLIHENAKVNAVNDTAQKFVDSGRYDKLPTEAERMEAIKEQKEAQEPHKPEPDKTEPEEPEVPEAGYPEPPEAGHTEPPEAGHPEQPEAGHPEPPEAGRPEAAVTGHPEQPAKSADTPYPVQAEAAKQTGTPWQIPDPYGNRGLSGGISRGAYGTSAYRETMSLVNQEAVPLSSSNAKYKKA